MACEYAIRAFVIGGFAAVLTFLSGTSAAEPNAAKSPPRTVRDIAAVLDDYKPDPDKVARIRMLLEGPAPATGDHLDIARFHVERARAALEVGAVSRAIADYRKALDLGGGNEPARTLKELSGAERFAGNFREAIALLERSIATTPRNIWGMQVGNYARLAKFELELGDMRAAEEALARSKSTLEDMQTSRLWPWFQATWTAQFEDGRAEYLLARGKYAEAEAMMQHALEMIDKQIEINPQVAARNLTNGPPVAYQQNRIVTLGRIAASQLVQGKFLEAEITLRSALQASLSQFGRDAPPTADITLSFAQFLNESGRYREAETMGREALGILQHIGAAPESLSIAKVRMALAESLVNQARWKDALAVYQTMAEALSIDPVLRRRYERGSESWATALIRSGRAEEAVAMLEPLRAQSAEWLGTKHYRTAELGGLLGMALARAGNRERSLDAFRASLPLTLGGTSNEKPSPSRAARLKMILESYVELLSRIRGTALEAKAGLDAAAEAFRMADAIRGHSTQQAVAASGARSAAGTPELAELIRREQDLKQEAASLRRILANLMAAPPEQRLPKIIADMQLRIAATGSERQTMRQEVERRFPAYHNLIDPKPATITQAREVLHQGEALISILNCEEGTYIWAFRRDGPVVFVRSGLTREALAQKVQMLRRSLDPGDVDIATGLPDFDVATAYNLYAELLLPAAAGWQGATSLLVAANGALSQLPLAVLPTADVALRPKVELRYGKFKDVPWLIRQAAITELPSVNALVTLRRQGPADPQRAPFVGFGDPQFVASPIHAAANTRKLRNLSVERLTEGAVPNVKTEDWIDYGQIPPLPDTRDELLAIAAALKADPAKDVFLGAQASKANVKNLDLTKRKIVAFATHGLLAGDFPGVDEPSLALANPGDGRHGLLTLEEILGLRLDADWVVLSACNTAAGDGAGADAISGLGRGFFYAGTRALLATHWPVESKSARLLVTGVFERQQGNPALSRAEALRQSMLALMSQHDEGFSFAHPLFWAPYALIGDGGGS